MAETHLTFGGFPDDTLRFLTELRDNNHREWFEANRQRYIEAYVQPAQAFVASLGLALKALVPDIRYDTNANGSGSIMRIYRDVRFSADKTPYHTYLRVAFWEGPGRKTECPAFYFGLDPDDAGMYVGLWAFPKPFLNAYRRVIEADDALASRLVSALEMVRVAGYATGGEQLQKTPRDFAADHPHADLLRYKGLWASSPELTPEMLGRSELVDICLEHCRKMAPLQRWLVEVQSRI